MNNNRSLVIPSVLLAALIAFYGGWALGKDRSSALPGISSTSTATFGDSRALPSQPRIDNLEEVWKYLQDGYYDASKLDLKKLSSFAVAGFVYGLQDPYTVYMTPEESKNFEDDLEGAIEGIGAELELKNGKLVIVTPLKNSPAAKANVKPKDTIIRINGEPTDSFSLMQAVKKIRGAKGTPVILTIVREGGKPFDVRIVRDSIVLESVTLKPLESNIFHLAINQFGDHTKQEFDRAVQQLLLSRADGLVLDMRGNGGGYLDSAVDIAAEFFKNEKIISIIKKRDPAKNEAVKTRGGGRLSEIPAVVLIDGGSASASEILAGALQDYKRATVIGEKSFGKGSVQELIKLNDGSVLRQTIAKWFTPLDRTIDETGIVPDIEVAHSESPEDDSDPQLDRAIEFLQNKGD